MSIKGQGLEDNGSLHEIVLVNIIFYGVFFAIDDLLNLNP